MNKRTKLIAAGCVICLAAGCRTPRPLLAPPGPVDRQQHAASYHDPYSDNDAGPAVDGGRPRDFDKPNAEPVRNQRFQNRLW